VVIACFINSFVKFSINKKANRTLVEAGFN
jgi:hypothetical protein